MLSLLINMNLKRLLKDLSGNIAFSEINFLALVDAYITRLDTNCSDVSARVSPSPARINKELNMEPTLTQNCALYTRNIQLQNAAPRFFQDFRAAARKQAADSYRQLTYGTRFRRLPFHRTTAAERCWPAPESATALRKSARGKSTLK